MTNRYNRIMRDINKFGGQPYIHDTDITVNQIITRSTEGRTITEILTEFPDLTTDDIHQALSFTITDIFNGVSYWRHDGMTPLTQIKGYSEILVGKTDFDDLDIISHEQKQQWLDIIHTSSQRGIARWLQMSQWMSKQYQVQPDDDIDVYQLERFIMDIVATAHNYEPSLKIQVAQFDSKLSIEIHSDSSLILGSVLAFAKNTFKTETNITFETMEQTVRMNIRRHLLYPDDDLQKLFATPYSPVATAFTFFHIHDVTFKIDQTNEHVTFSVDLPRWID